MAKITNKSEAINHVNRHDKNIIASASTLVVGSAGSVHINCNVDSICDQLESQKLEAFCIKGERSPKQKKKSEPAAQ